MSVKSTVFLTRDEAERKYVDLIMSHGNPEFFVWLAIRECNWDNEELSSNLEEMNDKANYGEGFENYIIVDEE